MKRIGNAFCVIGGATSLPVSFACRGVKGVPTILGGHCSRTRLMLWKCAVIILILPTILSAQIYYTVTSNSDATSSPTSGIGSSGDPFMIASLRGAFSDIDGHSGYKSAVINMQSAYNIKLGSDLMVAQNGGKTVVVNGNNSTIDGQNAYRCLCIDYNAAGSTSVTVNNLTLTKGKDATDTYGGGGIIDGTGSPSKVDTLTLSNCTITNCQATNGSGGGGIAMWGGRLTLTNCSISGNTANNYRGGGIALYGMGTVNISSCSFSGNSITTSASGEIAKGGAIFATNTGNDSWSVSVSYSSFTANTISSSMSASLGGAIYLEGGGTFAVTSCSFSGNTVASTYSIPIADGGAIYSNLNTGSGVTVTYSRLSGDSASTAGSEMYLSGGTMTAENNWWGCNSGPGGWDINFTTPSQFLQLRFSPARSTISTNDTTMLTADILGLSTGGATAASNLSGLPTFSASFGTTSGGTLSSKTNFVNGVATAILTAGSTGGTVTDTVTADNQNKTTTVTIAQAPSVTTQPSDQTVTAGNSASFSAAASGYPTPTVKWQVSTDGGSSWSDISGATNTTYSFTTASTDNGKKYRAVFANTGGSTNSNAATLTVNFSPTVTTQPSNQTVTTGSSVSFSASASGNPTPTVKWQVSTDGGSSWNDISGATNTTYSFTTALADNGRKYRAVFTNSIGSTNTDAATLTVEAINVTFADGSSYSPPAPVPGTDNNPVGSFKLTAAAPGAALSAVTVSFSGTAASVNGVNLWESTAAVFSTGTATKLSGTAQAYGSSVPIGSLSSSISATGTYYFVTLDLGASSGYTVASIANNSAITLSSGTLSGMISNAPLSAGDIPLPVQATNFLAKADVGSVTLSWETQSEVMNAGFYILRKDPDASFFRLIASYLSNDSLKGLGTSSTGRVYTFTDNKVQCGEDYEYKIQIVSTGGVIRDLIIQSVTVDVPKTFALYQNYPNPFNPGTTVRFDLTEQSNVTLEIYNALGQRVEHWNYGMMNAGRYDEEINMARFSSGLYFYRIVATRNKGEKFIVIKKLFLLK